jgi:hypothetical protein
MLMILREDSIKTTRANWELRNTRAGFRALGMMIRES